MIDNQLHNTNKTYHFSAFRLDAKERILWCSDENIPLTPKQFDLLFYFIENAGNLTTKSELLDAVWNDTYVEESTLARNVSWLRKKLTSYSNGERFIETVPKLGYRFTAEVSQSEAGKNTVIIEEQTIQHFRGEEIITFDETEPIIKEETWQDKVEEKIQISTPQNVSSISNRSMNISLLPLVALGTIILTVIGFAVFKNGLQASVPNTGLDTNAQIIIENITIDASQKNVDTGIKVQAGDIIDLSVVGHYQNETGKVWTFEGDKNVDVSTDQTFPKSALWSLVGWIGTESDKDKYFQVSKTKTITADKSGTLYFALNDRKNNSENKSGELNVTVTLNRPIVIGNQLIKIGSVVNLQNRYPNAGDYLDAWGQVWSKPEFSIVPTETKFVSTHRKPDRDNGSGSWEIVSATDKRNGEPLMVGDEIQLKNRHPNAGYLDTCGWIKDMPVFKDYINQTTAVFTTRSFERDNGTGTWIVRSASKSDGSPILEGDSIGLESSFSLEENGKIRKPGFLIVAGSVDSIPAFNDYDGSLLVFTQEISASQPIPDIWTITISKATLK
jgi:DNA-binding winged helix-turn-helix (wHTH) protein